jgi:hypothetical protein
MSKVSVIIARPIRNLNFKESENSLKFSIAIEVPPKNTDVLST